MKRSISVSLILTVLMFFVYGGKDTLYSRPSKKANGNSGVLKMMHKINKQLARQGLNIAVEAIEFFTIGRERPIIRIHQQPFRWVPYDGRRLADGDNITYLIDQTDGATTSSLSNAQTEPAIDRALNTWANCKALKKVEIVKRPDSGVDPDIYDWFYGFGTFGAWWVADAVNAGWLPKAFFDAVEPPDGGDYILAFSVAFIFTDGSGAPTDINGDNYLDTALNEVYYNDYFGWGIDIEFFDVETVALHENGHSLGIGHFGPPPIAVMNSVYAGIRHYLFPIDMAGMSAFWASWPNP